MKKLIIMLMGVVFAAVVQAQYNVTLNAKGGTGGAESVTATYGEPMPSAKMPSKADNVFLGYFDAEVNGTQYYGMDGESVTNWNKAGDAVLYAHWVTREKFGNLNLGAFDLATKTFKNATGSGEGKFAELVLLLGREYTSGDAVTLPAVNGYERDEANSTDYAIYITVSPAKTPSEIASEYLKKARFAFAKGQSLNVMLGVEAQGEKYFYFDKTGHYYHYVRFTDKELSWTEAYEAARNTYYGGRQGYLATVTSYDEDMFIYKASQGSVGWLGGTVLKPGEQSGAYYDSFAETRSSSTADYSDHWYWACGPECGEEFYDICVNQDKNKYNQASIQYRNLDKGYYFNWGITGSGNETYMEPNAPNRYIESCLTTLPFGQGFMSKFGNAGSCNDSDVGKGYSWNNVAYNSFSPEYTKWTPRGYLVEYGDQKDGDSHGELLNNQVVAKGVISASPAAVKIGGVAKGDNWSTLEVGYSLENVAVEDSYKLVFEVTVQGETKTIIADKDIATGSFSKTIDTEALFGKDIIDENAKVSIKLIKREEPESVQLWEDGPYWALSNVGATKAEDAGYYFNWGGTIGYVKSSWGFESADGTERLHTFNTNIPSYNKSFDQLISEGIVDENGNLTPEYDAATVNMGEAWRLPTSDEASKMFNANYCSVITTYQNGVKGYLITGVTPGYTDKSIFIPAAGNGWYEVLYNYGAYGYCWLSSHYMQNAQDAWGVNLDSRILATASHPCGFPVRAVRTTDSDGSNDTLLDDDAKTFALKPEPMWQVGTKAYAYMEDDNLVMFGEGGVTTWPTGLGRGTIKGVSVNDGVTTIDQRFFKKCYNMRSFTGGANLVSFGERAFYLCTSLETITLLNPAALESLSNAVVYQAAIDDEGRPYAIPRVTVEGYQEILYGKVNLSDAEWIRIGPVGPTMGETGYNFFTIRLEK